jgi:aldose 1-epimerase
MFGGFDAPSQRIALQRGAFFAEIWPELGGAIARFERRRPFGTASAVQALFRSTRHQARYLPTELACFPLLPYSNRMAEARFQIAGSAYALPRNLAGFEHPQHGIGWIRPWFVLEQHSERCTLRLDHAGDADWPCAFTAVQEIALTEFGLELKLDLINGSEQAMPCGIGQHPYIRRPAGTRIFAPVEGVWLSDEQRVPTHRIALPKQWNLPQGRVLDACFVDHCFDGLQGNVLIEWPDGSGLCISSSPAMPFLVVYSAPEHDFVCIEPVSQRPDAFNAAAADQRAAGVAMLEPRQSITVVQRFDYLPVSAPRIIPHQRSHPKPAAADGELKHGPIWSTIHR